MFREPDTRAVQEVAEQLGIRLTADEAEVYRRHITQALEEFDEFVQSRTGELLPPRYPGLRETGYRPGAGEDTHNAWMWKCSIEGTGTGLLAGKTVSYKDHIAVAGIPLTFGAFAMEGFVPDYDATVVQRALEAGATITGKNVMNGLAGGFGFGGGFGDYARPLNPHNPEHLTGGSSSGSAVALVRGEVDISFGGDQGGSIRIPASWSGTLGLKPTFGLASHFGAGFGSDQSIDYVGPMAMTVADCAAALEAVAGYDGMDPRQAKQVPDVYDATSKLAGGIKGVRIGIVDEGFIGATPEVSESVHAAIEVLAELGADVSKVSIPEHLTVSRAQAALSAEGGLAIRETGFFGAFAKTYYPSDTISSIMRLTQNHQESLDPRTFLNHLVGVFSRQHYAGRVYAKAQNVRPAYVRAYDTALSDVDVLIMPTTITQAPRFEPISDRFKALEFALAGTVTQSAVANTRPFNYTGHPALAVPCEKRNGLPVSFQLTGRMFEDDLLLRVANAYAESVPFSDYVAVGSDASYDAGHKVWR
jgi:amidase